MRGLRTYPSAASGYYGRLRQKERLLCNSSNRFIFGRGHTSLSLYPGSSYGPGKPDSMHLSHARKSSIGCMSWSVPDPLWAPTINVPNSERFTVHSRRYALSAVATHLLYSHGRPLSAYSGPFNGKQFIVTALIITFWNMLFGSRDAFGTSLQEECLLTHSLSDSEYSRPSHRYTVAPTSVPDVAVCASKAPLILEANTLYSGKTYPT